MNVDVLEARLAAAGGGAAASAPGWRRECADQVLDRVARTLGDIERRHRGGPGGARAWTERFRALMAENRFWPSMRILHNCGVRHGQLASWYVLPLADDFGGLFDTLKTAAVCHRSGVGTGFDLTPLRERGAPVRGAHQPSSSGPVSWLRLFDAETTVVAQGGRPPGGNLATLAVDHPDVLEFLDAKRGTGDLPTFRLAVVVDDGFMNAVAADHTVRLISPHDHQVTGSLPARALWQRICAGACANREPGLIFAGALHRANPFSGPPLHPYSSAHLGAINLRSFAAPQLEDGIDWSALRHTVAEAVRLLDNAIDASHYPDPRITRLAHEDRRLGLGVMGYADLLAALGIGYDSDAALDLADLLGQAIRDTAWQASAELAEQRGVFPHWRYSRLSTQVRNCAITDITPARASAEIAGCSPGIDPQPGRQFSGPRQMHIQARWQRHTDGRVVKSVTLPPAATPEDAGELYATAWRLGCKSVFLERAAPRAVTGSLL
jgi:ribonucleoside-diphosphate reductase alpha chain